MAEVRTRSIAPTYRSKAVPRSASITEALRSLARSGSGRRSILNFVAAHLLFVVAAVAVVNTGMRWEIAAGVTTGYALASGLLPLWFGAAARYRYYLLIVALAVLAGASGVALTAAHSRVHEVVWSHVTFNTVMLVGTVLSAGLILWVRSVMAEWQIGMLFGLGLAAMAGLSAGGDNPWKEAWSLPVTVLALSLARMAGNRVLGLAVLIGLAVFSAVQDARSFAAVLAMAAALVAAQMLPLPDSALRLGTVRMVLILAITGRLAYTVFSELALSGVLGESTRLRTEQQLVRAGSVLFGGRPEAAATLGLFHDHPQGFGSGTVLDPSGIAVAQQSMARVNYDGDNGYVYNYMFGDSIELHSGLGDLWAWFGLPGLVLAVVVIWALLDSLARQLSRQSASPLQAFITLLALWNMLFGPFYSMAPMLVLALGTGLVARGRPPFLGLPARRAMMAPGWGASLERKVRP